MKGYKITIKPAKPLDNRQWFKYAVEHVSSGVVSPVGICVAQSIESLRSKLERQIEAKLRDPMIDPPKAIKQDYRTKAKGYIINAKSSKSDIVN